MGPTPYDEKELEKLAGLVDAVVKFQDPGGNLKNGEVQGKIDLLERALGAWRVRQKHMENSLPLETFVQSNMFVDGGIVWFHLPEKAQKLGSGTPPIQLQTRLLLFLLLHHRRKLAVYDIIEKFINVIWDELDELDFKRTQTGVMRCFTNTRFAANTLREYGFLKYTQAEAYKTWVLSLPGFLVASEVLNAGVHWDLPPVKRMHNFDLHPDIRSIERRLQTYGEFVGVLKRVCEPNVEVFETFKDVLAKAHQLLRGYWEAVQNREMSQKDRKAETTRRLKFLEEQPRMGDFYNEFSACVNVEMLLSDIEISR